MPAFFLIVFGYALNFDIRNIALAVEDRDGTAESRELVSAFVNSGYFNLAAAVRESAMKPSVCSTRNDARAVLVIPEGYSEAGATGGRRQVQVIVNGDNANTATTVIGYATSILRAAAGERRGRSTSNRASGTTPSCAARCSWFPA